MQPGFEIFDHGADVGVLGWGASVEEAFIQGAKAMFSLMTEDLQSVKCRDQIQVQVAGYDMESMFVAWLNGLLTQSDLHGLLLTEFEVHLENNFLLTGWARGEPFDVDSEESGVEVKGATFCQTAVYEDNGKWVAQCVVDV
jgi:SHS2 domain-containing protein